MNCVQVEERLSVYHDGELPIDLQAQVEGHVDHCLKCRGILATFRDLSTLSSQLVHPEPPSRLWAEIEQALGTFGTPPDVSLRSSSRSWQRTSVTLAAIAALVLIAASVGLFAYRLSPLYDTHHESTIAANFGQYLNNYQRDRQQAQEVLLASYEGRAVDLLEATRHVGYEPIAAKSLPPGYSVDGIYVLNMPCCTCAQVVCRRDDGGVVTIFEHDQDQPGWFGERPAINACCRGKPTKMVQVDGMLAVTWKSGKRHLTVVGARDLEEVTQLIAHMEDSASPSYSSDFSLN